MNLIIKMMAWIKCIFIQQEQVKQVEAPKRIQPQEEKINFVKSLKVTTTAKIGKNKIKTLTCTGDGLGIQKKIGC